MSLFGLHVPSRQRHRKSTCAPLHAPEGIQNPRSNTSPPKRAGLARTIETPARTKLKTPKRGSNPATITWWKEHFKRADSRTAATTPPPSNKQQSIKKNAIGGDGPPVANETERNKTKRNEQNRKMDITIHEESSRGRPPSLRKPYGL